MDQEQPFIETDDLVGYWIRIDELDGRSLPLHVDSTFVFDSVTDTLFRYGFDVEGNTIFLDDRQETVTQAVIEKLTADSLVLSNLPFTDRTLRFVREASQ